MDQWPNQFDGIIILAFLAIVLLVPALGYFFMIADYRAYLRSMRRMMVKVVNYLPHLPQWAVQHTPRCLSVFGLQMPSTVVKLKKAYREQIKELHPDRGGDKEKFLLLQGYFEEALQLIRENDPKQKSEIVGDRVD